MATTALQDHHIIPQDLAKNDDLLNLLNQNNLFNVDDTLNRLYLPSTADLAAELGTITPHSGGPLSSYETGVQNFLDELARSPDFAATQAGDQAQRQAALQRLANAVTQLRDTMKVAILNGDLFTNNPAASTGIDAAAKNAAFFGDVAGYAERNAGKIAEVTALQTKIGGDAAKMIALDSSAKVEAVLTYAKTNNLRLASIASLGSTSQNISKDAAAALARYLNVAGITVHGAADAGDVASIVQKYFKNQAGAITTQAAMGIVGAVLTAGDAVGTYARARSQGEAVWSADLEAGKSVVVAAAIGAVMLAVGDLAVPVIATVAGAVLVKSIAESAWDYLAEPVGRLGGALSAGDLSDSVDAAAQVSAAVMKWVGDSVTPFLKTLQINAADFARDPAGYLASLGKQIWAGTKGALSSLVSNTSLFLGENTDELTSAIEQGMQNRLVGQAQLATQTLGSTGVALNASIRGFARDSSSSDLRAVTDVEVNAGNIVVNAAPSAGWTKTTQLGPNSNLTEVVSSTDSQGKAITLNYTSSGGDSTVTLSSASFSGQNIQGADPSVVGSAVFNALDSVSQTVGSASATLTGANLTHARDAIQSAVSKGDGAAVAGSLGGFADSLAPLIVATTKNADLSRSLATAMGQNPHSVAAIVPQKIPVPDPIVPTPYVPGQPIQALQAPFNENYIGKGFSYSIHNGVLTDWIEDGKNYHNGVLLGAKDLAPGALGYFLQSIFGYDIDAARNFLYSVLGLGTFHGDGSLAHPWTFIPNGNFVPISLPVVSPGSGNSWWIDVTVIDGNGNWLGSANSNGPSRNPIVIIPQGRGFSTALADPLVFSLDGHDVQFIPADQSHAKLNIGAGGKSTQTGWVGPNTGILVSISQDGNVVLVPDFANLATLDANHDGVIDASDPNFASLAVWADANGDGVVQPGELKTLESLGIKSIGVTATPTNQNVAGNVITATGVLTFADGRTEVVDNVTFGSLPTPPSAPQLDGQSAASLAFYSRVLAYRTTQARGVAQAVAQAMPSLEYGVPLWGMSQDIQRDPYGKGGLLNTSGVHVVNGALSYDGPASSWTPLRLDNEHIYILGADGNVRVNEAPHLLAGASSSISNALTAMEAAAQAVVAAAGNQSASEGAAMSANMQNAALGSASDVGAMASAAVTEQSWRSALTSVSVAWGAMTRATADLTSSGAAVSALQLPAGALYIDDQDVQEAIDAAISQNHLVEIQANGAAAFETLLGAIAQAWNVSQVTYAGTGSSVQAAGGDLVLVAAGTESISDGSAPSTYVILPGAQVQIQGFHVGAGGSKLDFLSPGEALWITQTAAGVQMTNGGTSVLLAGVAVSQLGWYENVAGISAISFNGLTSAIVNLASRGGRNDDGTTHISTLTMSGASNTLIANGGTDVLTATGTSNVLVSGDGVARLSATGSNNTLLGGAGTDQLIVSGSGTHNVLIGGSGTEQLSVDETLGQQGANTLIAGSGNDVLHVTGDQSTLIAGGGVDALIASGNGNTLVGGSGNDILQADGHGNVLQAGSGTSELVSRATGNTLIGGGRATQAVYSGNDLTVDLSRGFASVNGGTTSDTLIGIGSVAVAGDHATLLGGSLFGTLAASGQGDTLISGSGGAVLTSKMNGNTLIAGSALTVAQYTNDGLAIDLGAGTVKSVRGGGANDTLLGITRVMVTGNDDVVISSSAGGDRLEAFGTNDTLIAAGTKNTLSGGNATTFAVNAVGANTLIAGTGSNVASYSGTGISIDLAAGTVTGTGAEHDTLIGTFSVAQATGTQETLLGGRHLSTLASNAGGNSLIAGSAATAAWFSGDAITVDLGAGTAVVNGATVHDTLLGITRAVVAGQHDMLRSAAAGGDTLFAFGVEDTLVALGAGNTLEGGTHVATLLGNGAGNTLIAGTGQTVATYGSNATVDLGAGVAAINGTGAHDVLVGISIADATGTAATLIGSTGTSTLVGNVQGNTLIGGAGRTAAEYSGMYLTVNLDTGTARGTGAAPFDTLSKIAIGVIAGDNNTLIGGSGDVLVNLSGNNDTLVATGTGETLQGGSGRSTLVSSVVGNTLLGGAGATTAAYVINGTVVDLQAGTVSGNGQTGTIKGIANVQVQGNHDTVVGGGVGQTLAVTGEFDTILGAGHSVLLASGNDDVLIGALGGADFLQATNGNRNTLIALGSGNTLAGGAGDTTLVSNVAGNTLISGAGRTVASYAGSGITVNLETGTAVANGASTGTDTLIGITAVSVSGDGDTLIGSKAGGDDLHATGVGDTLIANGGHDVLRAGSTNATLASNAAGNTLIGSSASTVAYYGGNGVTVNLVDQVAGVNGATVSDTLVGIQVAQAGGAGDTLYGGSGSSTLISNGAGNTLIAGTNRTVAWYAESGMAVNLSNGVASANSGNTTDRLIGMMAGGVSGANDTLIGGAAGGNFLIAKGSNDTLIAFGSGNTLIGASSTDTLITNAAGNTLEGGAGAATAVYTGDNLAVNLANGLVSGAGASGSIVGVSHVIAAGLNDTLIAGNSTSTLSATGSHDTLIGGLGATTLIGDGNSNTLVAGTGLSVAQYFGAGAVINLATQRATSSGTSGDTLVGIKIAEVAGASQTLIGADNAVSTLVGNAAGNTLIGGAGRVGSEAYYLGDGLIGDMNHMSFSGTGGGDTLTAIKDVRIVGNHNTFAGNSSITGDYNTLNSNGKLDGFPGLYLYSDTLIGNHNTLIGAGDISGNSNVLLGGGTVAGDSNTLIGNDYSILISSSGSNNVLIGMGRATVMKGGTGTTTLVSNATGDMLYGGAGPTVAAYADNVYVDLTAGLAEHWPSPPPNSAYPNQKPGDPAYPGDTLSNITIAQASGRNAILIAGAHDTISGNGQGNTLIGQYDTQLGYLGTAYFYADHVFTDLAQGTARVEDSHHNVTFDTLVGGFAKYVVSGDNDILVGKGGGRVLLQADGNNDTLIAGHAGSYQSFNDSSPYHLGGNVPDSILNRTWGDTKLAGGSGTSVLVSLPSSNTLIGGTGKTVAAYGAPIVMYDATWHHPSFTDEAAETFIGSGVVINLAAQTVSGGYFADYIGPWRLNNNPPPTSKVANTGIDRLIGITIAEATGTGETLIGGAGSTTLVSNGTGNTLLAGSSATVAYYENDNVTVNLGGVTGPVGQTRTLNGTAGFDVLIGFRAAQVTGANVQLTGSRYGGNLLKALGTRDQVYAGGANDTLLILGGSQNGLHGAGHDTLMVQDGTNAILSGSGSDTLEALGGIGSTLVGSGGDTLIGAGGAAGTTLMGSLNHDTLIAQSKRTEVYYTNYDVPDYNLVVDLRIGVAADNVGNADTLIGITSALIDGSGNTLIGSNSGGDYLQANGSSTLIAAGINNTLVSGGSGNATLMSSQQGGNTLVGRDSSALAYYDANFMNIDLMHGLASAYGRLTDGLVGVTKVEVTGRGETLTGGATASTLVSTSVGSNTLIAGTGVTEVLYVTNNMSIDLAAGRAKSSTNGAEDTLVGVNVVATSGQHNTLTSGGILNATLQSTGTGNTLIAVGATGSSEFLSSSGNGHDIFDVNRDSQSVSITSGGSNRTAASNELDFLGGISDNELWFSRSGNNLEIDVLGTNTSVNVNNWFQGAGSQLQKITAGGLSIDSQVSQLVQAMASYSVSHPGFSAHSTTQMPTDTAIQSVIAASWHA
ncbi:calcium-binding protein [Burkholderia sp. GS2Y]|uniref:Calcium-binding protein n=1 Tax=Burkholderia theae TaxID=3143496 RepID=A0ABU9WDF0_9BURK